MLAYQGFLIFIGFRRCSKGGSSLSIKMEREILDKLTTQDLVQVLVWDGWGLLSYHHCCLHSLPKSSDLRCSLRTDCPVFLLDTKDYPSPSKDCVGS